MEVLSNVFAPGFLAMIEEESSTSYTIWNHAKMKIEMAEGRFAPESIEDLLSSFDSILSPNVIRMIQIDLEILKKSYLGIDTTLVRSRASTLDNILEHLMELFVNRTELDRVNLPGKVANSGRGKGGGRKGRGGRGKCSERLQDHLDNQDDEEEDGEDEGSPNALWFKTSLRIMVKLSLYMTPPKVNKPLQKKSIRDRAQLFADDSQVQIHHISYNLHLETGVCTLYHGTRVSQIDSFLRLGVQPFKTDTEFSPLPAFYLTNDVCAAFEFPLHNRPSRNTEDTVAVFQFEVPLRILHGLEECPSGTQLKVCCFKTGIHDKTWKRFCEKNMYGKSPKTLHDKDVVIGPMCIPDNIRSTVRQRHPSFTEIAFCSKVSWGWISSCVKRIFIEDRVDETTELHAKVTKRGVACQGHKKGSEPKSTTKLTKNMKDSSSREDSKNLHLLISTPELDLVSNGANALEDGGMKVGRQSKKRQDEVSGVVSVIDVAKGRL